MWGFTIPDSKYFVRIFFLSKMQPLPRFIDPFLLQLSSSAGAESFLKLAVVWNSDLILE